MKIEKLILVLMLLALNCDRFPSNPAKEKPDPATISIEHIQTEYISADPLVVGMKAEKVNILYFKIRAENFNAKAVEFWGIAKVGTATSDQEHLIHYRTDCVEAAPESMKNQFNTIEKIFFKEEITLIRPKFPSNEYTPFEGDLGMVKEILITEVFGYDENSSKFPIVCIRD